MQKTVTYTLSWERELRTLRQQYRALLWQRRDQIFLRVFIGFSAAVLIELILLKGIFFLLPIIVLFGIALIMLRDYALTLAIAKKRLDILRDLAVSIELDDHGIRYITSNIQKNYHWQEIDSSLDTADILILQKQQVPVATLDKDLFEPETLTWIRQQVQAQNLPQTAST